MKKYINTWFKGWNRDRAKNKYGNENYFYAENLRLNDRTSGSTYDLTNIDGNALAGAIDLNYRLYTYTVLRDYIFLLAIHKDKATDPTKNDYLYKIYTNSTGTLFPSLVYEGNLGLLPNSTYKKMISVYESATVQKIYWTCGESIRYCNIADPLLYTYPTGKFNIIPSHIPGSFTISSIGEGSLKSGVVQYSYQLYNLNGAATSFLTISDLVPLSTSSTNLLPDIDFKGSSSETEANKSVSFTISNIDYTNFNRIKIVRIFYSSILTDPEITYIADINSAATIAYTDTGSTNEGNLTVEEFNFINYYFNCNTLEVKNNILFAGGITEQVYDPTWDSRAYRFANNGSGYVRATIFNANSSVPDMDVTPSNWNTVPSTHDCYNLNKNDITYDDFVAGHPSSNYAYQSNGFTLGAEGPNIKIDVTRVAIDLDNTQNSIQYSVSTNYRNSNSLYNSLLLGYQRDEIYSFAIQLVSNKGQLSSAKWICDFRMPTIQDGYDISTSSARTTYGYILNVTFTIKSLPTDCIGYRILRCERTSKDRTILAQGIIDFAVKSENASATDTRRLGNTLVSVKEYGSGGQHLDTGHYIDTKLLLLSSPEISFNKNFEYNSSDYIEMIGIGKMGYHFYKLSPNGSILNDSSFNFDYYKNAVYSVKKITDVGYAGTKQRLLLTDARLLDSPPGRSSSFNDKAFSVEVDGTFFVNSVFRVITGSPNQDITAKGCTKIVAKTTCTISLAGISDSTGYGTKCFLANYKRPVVQYGGNSYQNRMNRTYIPCTSFIPSTTTTVTAKNGDIFLDYFECVRSMINGLDDEASAGYDNSTNLFETICFPVETSIHVKWANYETYNKNVSNNNHLLMQEKAGLHVKASTGLRYEQETDLYSYNSVYSTGNKITTVYPKNDLVSANKIFDTRIQWSERKYNNENIDNWSIWKPLNCKDIDSQYGKIQSLVNYNTRLLFFQSNAVGILSVEEREIVPGNNSSQLVLGSGTVGQRFDYISTACGTIHPDSIIPCKAGIYWYDKYNNSLFVYEPSQNVDNATKLSGIQSYFYENITDSTALSNVIAGYDPKYNEVLFTFSLNYGIWNVGKKTIAYNEMSKNFVGCYSFEPSYYINTPTYLYSTNNLYQIWKHNDISNKGYFYGSYSPSILEIIINPEGDKVTRFDVLEWITDVTGDSTTFSTLTANNDYVSTGTITLTSGSNLIRRFRTWRFNQLRAQSSFERMKDYYMKARFVFNDSGTNKTLKVHDIVTTYEYTAPY